VAAVTLRDRLHRVRVGFRLALQAALAAGLAWYVARDLLKHVQPFFAPIAAIVVLAISTGQRMRRAVELVVGNAVGILLGEVLILLIGRGAWQITIVVLLALCVALFVGGSPALMTQAASSASLVVTIFAPRGSYFFQRFIDAVVGGLVGLAVMALLLPLNPLTVVRRAANPVLDDIAAGLSDVATALAEHGGDSAMTRATANLDRLRATETHLRAYNDAIAAGREIATFAPIRWRAKNALQQYVDSYNHIARALRNSRVLTRRVIAMIRDGEPVPEPLPRAIRELALAVGELRRELAEGVEPIRAREHAAAAVTESAQAYGAGLGFSGSVVVAQIRSTASDLISATGLEPEEAHRMVRQAPLPGR
jgi:uncharacterized membrane protein YgaE (UPF0421/DUF939 family)